MRKVLLATLLAFAILLPEAQVQAVDVPNFKQVVGDSFSGGKRENEKDYRVYTYVVRGDDVKNSEVFAEKYVNFLQKKGITLVEHTENRYKDRIDY